VSSKVSDTNKLSSGQSKSRLIRIPESRSVCFKATSFFQVVLADFLADYAWNLISLYSVIVTSLTAQVNVYRLGNDYALSGVTRDDLDPVGV
jgi:hypothetical protein